jgi:hypothetical protein
MNELRVRDFRWAGHAWQAEARLPSWQGYRSRDGAYGRADSATVSDGTVELTFAPEGRDDSPLRPEELALVNWALEHERAMRDALVSALLDGYAVLRDRYAGSLDRPEQMPVVDTVDGFRALVGLHGLNVHPIACGGVPYVGFELGCTWDDEHGLGVLMHGTRVVKIGGGDTAILLWLAKQDAARGART